MGKLAAALGIGVKGSIAVALERSTCEPGETVIGQITLKVHVPFDTKALRVAINGKELLQWEVRKNERAEQHKRSRVWLQEQQTFATPQRYEPGDYVFPFEFSLPLSLPNSFEYRTSSVFTMRNVYAGVLYTVTASLPVLGDMKADLVSNHTIHIGSPSLEEPRPLASKHKMDVNVLGLFDKGHCTLTASLASNTLHPKEDAQIHCTIENEAKKRVKHLRVELVQLIEFLRSENHMWPRSKSRKVNQIDYFSVNAGETRNIVLQFPMVDQDNFVTLLPTLESDFVRVSYRLIVKCKYSLSEGATVSFPLELVPIGARILTTEMPKTVVPALPSNEKE